MSSFMQDLDGEWSDGTPWSEDDGERRCAECDDSFNLEEHGEEPGDNEPELCVFCDMRDR